MFEMFYVIYILVGSNHIYMALTRTSNGIGWRFADFSIWEINRVNLHYIGILNLGLMGDYT